MKNLEEINEYIENSSMILIINNNSKPLMTSLFNYVYNKYPKAKSKCSSGKGLYQKLLLIKNKLVRIEFDLSKIQFTSSNNYIKLRSDFLTVKTSALENNTKILFRTDLFLYKDVVDVTKFFYNIPQYNVFDLVILIDKKNIRILKYEDNSYGFFKTEDGMFNFDTLIRSTKLKQIQNRLKMYEKES